MEKREILIKILRIVMIIGIAAIVGMMLICAGFSFLAEDDFTFEGATLDLIEEFGSHLKGAFAGAYRLAKTNQGTYLFNFLIHYVNPYNRAGLPGLHLVMISLVLLFFGSIFYLLKGIIKNKTLLYFFMLLCSAAVCCVAGSAAEVDFFFWYTGAMNYTLEMALSFISIGMLVRSLEQEKLSWLRVIACAVVSFLASGGALCITAANCAWILILLVLNFDKLKKNKRIIIPFISAVTGAIINTVAPGNFPRAQAARIEGHSGIADALKDTFVCFGNEHKSLWGSPVFLLILLMTFVVAFLAGGCLKRQISLRQLLILVGATLITQLLVIFPVLLGYHTDTLYTPRTQASYEIVAKLMYIFLIAAFALWLRNVEIKTKILPIGAAIIIAVGLFLISGNKTGDYDSYFMEVARDFKSGALLENYKNRTYVLSILEQAEPGSDLVIYMKHNVPVESALGMGITDNPEDHISRSAAGRFGLNSVAIIWLG